MNHLMKNSQNKRPLNSSCLRQQKLKNVFLLIQSPIKLLETHFMLNILQYNLSLILLSEEIALFHKKMKESKDLLLLQIFRLIRIFKTMFVTNIKIILMKKILDLNRLKLEEFKVNMKNYMFLNKRTLMISRKNPHLKLQI